MGLRIDCDSPHFPLWPFGTLDCRRHQNREVGGFKLYCHIKWLRDIPKGMRTLVVRGKEITHHSIQLSRLPFLVKISALAVFRCEAPWDRFSFLRRIFCKKGPHGGPQESVARCPSLHGGQPPAVLTRSVSAEGVERGDGVKGRGPVGMTLPLSKLPVVQRLQPVDVVPYEDFLLRSPSSRKSLPPSG